MGGGMGGGIDTYILLTASGRWSHSLPTFKLMRRLKPKGFIESSTLGVAIMNGLRYGRRDCKRYVQ